MTNRTLPGFSSMTQMRWAGATRTVLLGAVLAATSIGCGDSTSPTAPDSGRPPAPRPPSPPMTTTVPAATNGEPGVSQREISMAFSGTATVTLRWANADFSLQLYVTSGVCSGVTSLIAGKCTVLGSTRPGSLPGIVTGPVTAGDLYSVWVLNTDPAPQDFRVDVTVE